jgi:hypothetical protein
MKSKGMRLVVRSLFTVTTILLIVMILSSVPVTSGPSEVWTCYLEPQDSSGTCGTPINVAVKVGITSGTYPAGVCSYQDDIYYDQSCVTITNVDQSMSPFMLNDWHLYGNYVRISSMNGLTEIPIGVSTIAELTLECNSSGTCGLTHNNYEANNEDGDQVTQEWINGSCTCSTPCAAATAVYMTSLPAEVRNPDEILNPLRALRDDYLEDTCVASYYDYSNELAVVIAKDPALAQEAVQLLVQYSPLVKHEVYGIGADTRITAEDKGDIMAFISDLRMSVLKNREVIGAERTQEIVNYVDEFKEQVEVLEGKTFSEALQGSIYFKNEQLPCQDIVDNVTQNTRGRTNTAYIYRDLYLLPFWVKPFI